MIVHQAAISGGYCGGNVCHSFAHLSRTHDEPEGPTELWQDLLVDNFGPVERVVAAVAGDGLQGLPAAFFADQSKSFERLSLAWYALVLRGWGMPPWFRRSMLALAAER